MGVRIINVPSSLRRLLRFHTSFRNLEMVFEKPEEDVVLVMFCVVVEFSER